MATPNYGYEKRQKELAKKRKKEDKLKARADRKTGSGEDGEGSSDMQPDMPESGPATGPVPPAPNGA